MIAGNVASVSRAGSQLHLCVISYVMPEGTKRLCPACERMCYVPEIALVAKLYNVPPSVNHTNLVSASREMLSYTTKLAIRTRLY